MAAAEWLRQPPPHHHQRQQQPPPPSEPPQPLRTKKSFLRPRLFSKSSAQHIETASAAQPPPLPSPPPKSVYVPTHAASSFTRSTTLAATDRRASVRSGRRSGSTSATDSASSEAASDDYALFLAAADAADRPRFRTAEPPSPAPMPYPRSAAPRAMEPPTTTLKPLHEVNTAQKRTLRRTASSIPSRPTCASCDSTREMEPTRTRTLRRQSSWAVQQITEYIKPTPVRDIIIEEH